MKEPAKAEKVNTTTCRVVMADSPVAAAAAVARARARAAMRAERGCTTTAPEERADSGSMLVAAVAVARSTAEGTTTAVVVAPVAAVAVARSTEGTTTAVVVADGDNGRREGTWARAGRASKKEAEVDIEADNPKVTAGRVSKKEAAASEDGNNGRREGGSGRAVPRVTSADIPSCTAAMSARAAQEVAAAV